MFSLPLITEGGLTQSFGIDPLKWNSYTGVINVSTAFALDMSEPPRANAHAAVPASIPAAGIKTKLGDRVALRSLVPTTNIRLEKERCRLWK